MSPEGTPRARRAIHEQTCFGVLGAGLALSAMAAAWGFTVDDALITARVAGEWARSGVYRYNPVGAPVDAVTPLGFPLLLAPWAEDGVLAGLRAARWIGAGCWAVAAAVLAGSMARRGGRPRRLVPLVVLLVCTPLAAWAVSGMETGVILLLTTLALVPRRWAAVAAGLAGAWRPELLPWSTVVALGTVLVQRPRPRAWWLALAGCWGPAALVAIARRAYFGSWLPLSFVAKAPDLQHGFWYVLGAWLFAGPFWMLMAPRAVTRLPARERVLLAAIVVHSAAVMLAGGDWMPLYRLMTPVLPSALLVASALAEHSRWPPILLRLGLACGVSLLTASRLLPSSREVWAHRESVIQQLGPLLQGRRTVAALDIGVVGAATSAPVLDLAGLTDPIVARLPGGHTSKKVPQAYLARRGVDSLVLLLGPGAPLREPWYESVFARVVEQRLALYEDLARYGASGLVALGGTHQSYVVLVSPPETLD